MKTTALIAAVIAAGSSAAYAQDPPTAAPPAAQTAPAATPAPARSAPASEDRLREVKFMEEVLASAVKAGASELAYRMRQVDPTSLAVVTPPHARGIALDGYGVVFDVDVPLMNLSVVTDLRQSYVHDLRRQIDDIEQYLARSSNPDEQQRLQLQLHMLQGILQTMAPGPDPRANTALDARAANGLATVASQPPGTVGAASTDTVPALPPIETRDTNELYSDAVKRSLVDAMLNHSAALRLGDDEWLTVAARDNAGPTIAGALDQRSGIILRIKGSDLTAYQRSQLTREEIMKRLEIREWR
ncbi:MAG TPA: hypothetical protein VH138_13845 [Vicinamibacterales bacterium]|jgi:hypothetical protein|nr:hypothetical protein [Vicinamibacterales bacterium]